MNVRSGVIYGLQAPEMFNFVNSHYLKIIIAWERETIYICLRTEVSF